jgi:serine protease AprX
MRRNGSSSFEGEIRSSALGGKGSNGGSRSSALWGKKGGRSFVASAATLVALLVPVAAASAASDARSAGRDEDTALVPASLLAQAQAHPDQLFDVIVQGDDGKSSSDVASDVASENGKLKKKFLTLSGVEASVAGKDLLKLARHSHVLAITPNAQAKVAAYQSNEVWRKTVKADQLWGSALSPAPQAPAIAIVDSGVDASKVADFGARVVAQVDLTGAGTADLNGHGTMVAGLAAGSSSSYPGVARNAPVVSLRTANAQGMLKTSDLISAADWILANKARYNVRVANFSLKSAGETTFRYDPLDKAVEKLWFSGVVVVAAAGNHGNGGPVSMSYAPGNDPFVITVGALDTRGTSSAADDTAPAWSAYGHTADGFQKPDLGAPGRFIVGPVPAGSTLATTAPERIVAPGYMWMSGTSLAAPIVSGAAAQLLARHPEWTPDQVKGALMSTASATLAGAADGKGELSAAAAASATSPANPNAALEKYVSNGSFNQAAWTRAASTGQFQADWLATDWLATDWLQTDWLATGWLQTDRLQTDWLQSDWLE